jgi:hypothetical protein
MFYEGPEPVPATWFRESAAGIRRPPRSHDGAPRGAVVACTPWTKTASEQV